MSETSNVVEKRIRLSPERVERLSQLAQAQQVTEDQVVERALDLLFDLTERSDEHDESSNWSLLSENALRRVWDNDLDARYDSWRETYGSSTG